MKAHKKIQVYPSRTRLVSYFGEQHPTQWVAHLPVTYKGLRLPERFYVIDARVAPTLCGDTAELLGLRRSRGLVEEGKDKKNSLWVKNNPTVFRGGRDIKDHKVD